MKVNRTELRVKTLAFWHPDTLHSTRTLDYLEPRSENMQQRPSGVETVYTRYPKTSKRRSTDLFTRLRDQLM